MNLFSFLMSLSLFVFFGCAGKGSDILNQVNGILSNNSLTQSEIVSGLKQALEIGTTKGVQTLGQKNAFLGNSLYKIVFPPEAVSVEQKLRSVGLGSLCDQAIASFNKAAENAIPLAKPIFIDAITSMTFSDAMTILKGNKDEATQYFKSKTSAALIQAFKPSVANSLQDVQATQYWDQAVTAYNKIPLSKPVATDLSAYVTQKTLNALFMKLSEVEAGIRHNPVERTTDLLKRVFGQADVMKKGVRS